MTIAPFIFTRDWGFISFIGTGEIGDTIGGITAPITGLIGAVLVFFALKAQIDANQLIFDQFEFQKKEEEYRRLYQFISIQIDTVRSDIRDISHNSTRTQGEMRENINLIGSAAISHTLYLASEINQNHTEKDIYTDFPNLSLIKIILQRLSDLTEKIENFKLKIEDQKYLIDLVQYTYLTKLKPYLDKFQDKRMSLAPPCNNCGKNHSGIPEDIYELYDYLNNKYSM